MSLKNIFLLLILLNLCSPPANSQILEDENIFSGGLLTSLSGGLTFSSTDYKTSGIGVSGTASLEYLFPSPGSSLLGIKVFGGGFTLKGEDDRESISVSDGTIKIPGEFSTDVITFGLGISYSHKIEKLYPFFGLTLSMLNFSPKNTDGTPLQNNIDDKYEKSILAFSAETGMRIPVSANFSMTFSGGVSFPSTDYLEDVKAGSNNDLFSFLNLSLSYNLFGDPDTDGDGIKDSQDFCPDEKEDFDGFQDNDGCPDPDNDGDGISDDLDQCPDDPEDHDGFEDQDGCPDTDNDGDNIPDNEDLCPDLPEDFDNFQDTDGCPEFDNDGDKIPDELDKCPDLPETYNSYKDQDGCPDVNPNATEDYLINEIVIQADDIFYPGTAQLNPDGYQYLDNAVQKIKSNPGAYWRIEGHMDSQGTVQWIRNMSSMRAEAVLNYFVSKGLDSKYFNIYGMGDKFPVANNTTEYGRHLNRRIEIIRER